MKELTITYELSDEHVKRLQKIREKYQKQGLTFTEEELFEFIMKAGSFHDIDSKFKLHEKILGLVKEI